MLVDFRFVLGAILAIAVLAVAGLGLVTSVQLVREARIAPIEDARSLAFAGRTEWNQFYDPDGARRFDGSAGGNEVPLAETRLETPAETSPVIAPLVAPLVAPLSPEERTASIPAHRLDPDRADDRTPGADFPHAEPPPMAQIPVEATIAAPPAADAPAPDVPGTTGTGARLAERVASAPATSTGPDLTQETRVPTRAPTQPQASGDPLQGWATPTPRARPKVQVRKKIARIHTRRVAQPSQQTLQNSGFPASAPWPGYDTRSTGATTTTKNTGKLANRPQ